MNFLYVSFVQGHYQSEKKHCHTTQNTATPSGNNAIKFSAEVSEAHAAARVKGPDAANIDNRACIEAFQQPLLNPPWTQKIVFSVCSASRVVTFENVLLTPSVHTHFCFLAKGHALAN